MKASKPWFPLISKSLSINSHLWYIFHPSIYSSIWYTNILHQSILSYILSWCTLGFQITCLGILLHGVTQKRCIIQGDAFVSMEVWLFDTNKLTLSQPFIICLFFVSTNWIFNCKENPKYPFIKCLHTSCINILNIAFTLYPSHFITLLNLMVYLYGPQNNLKILQIYKPYTFYHANICK